MRCPDFPYLNVMSHTILMGARQFMHYTMVRLDGFDVVGLFLMTSWRVFCYSIFNVRVVLVYRR